MSCAYELMHAVRKEDRVTLISNKSFFEFTPSNPWVAVKWRSKDDITIDLAGVLPRHGIAFSAAGAARLHPAENRVELGDGSSVEYDYLVVLPVPSWPSTRSMASARSTTRTRFATSITR